MADEISLAVRKRLEAARARRLAKDQTDDVSIAALISYAEECENDAVLLERQRAELHQAVGRSQKLSSDIRQLSDEARRQLTDIRRKLTAPAPGLPGENEADGVVVDDLQKGTDVK